MGLSAPLSPVFGAFWRKPLAYAQTAAQTVMDKLLPPTCLTCEMPTERMGQLCADCFRRTSFITEPMCARCGVPFAFPLKGEGERLCPGCIAHPPLFQRARAALRYDAQARALILPLKYADRTEIAGALAAFMARAGAALLQEADVLVPVPLHWRRRIARRYNQAALLARSLARLSRRPAMLDALVRLRPTETLGAHSAAERAAILEHAIGVKPGRVSGLRGKRVLIVDDVLTSGATANACAKALLQAGASAVDVIAAARVPDPRLG
ncbi:MAG: ComF family protein [Acidobacteriia bacterium]|nr:ComF family protein [Methyloceanibacter sp.]MBX5472367.1 ComF family protein [Acetobacteraceae bacterium]MCL6491797.1 ComF family protein [Terriglobia bacterium]